MITIIIGALIAACAAMPPYIANTRHDNGSALARRAGPKRVTYRGGPVIKNVESPLFDVLYEYGVGKGSAVPGIEIFGQTAIPSENDVGVALQGMARDGKIFPNENTYYAVHLPGPMQECAAPLHYCAYHSSTYYNNGAIYFGVMPNFGAYGQCQCGTAPDNFYGSTSHELMEAVTDPLPGLGWYDDSNGEIGDICGSQMQSYGSGLRVQKMWSNRAGACIASGPVPYSILGFIDRVNQNPTNGDVTVSGWACEYGNVNQISVHIYAGAAGQGRFLASVPANRPAQDDGDHTGIANSCGLPPEVAASGSFRFEHVFTHDEYKDVIGAMVHAYGLATRGETNSPIGNSGKWPIASTDIRGYIDGVTQNPATGDVTIIGWACEYGNPGKINLEIYAGGVAIATETANLDAYSNDERNAFAALCNVPVAAASFRFESVLKYAQYENLVGQTVSVIAFANEGEYSPPLTNSGTWPIAQTSIRGYIDGVTKDQVTGDVTVIGWACEYGNSQPITVNIQAGGITIASVIANHGALTSKELNDFAILCNVPVGAVSFRFESVIKYNDYQSLVGQMVSAVGVPTRGEFTVPLRNSGNWPIA